jgi:hypothetical protein
LITLIKSPNFESLSLIILLYSHDNTREIRNKAPPSFESGSG